ncbi:MAG: hypothetical protein ACQSGP_24590 [Frankia sp.]
MPKPISEKDPPDPDPDHPGGKHSNPPPTSGADGAVSDDGPALEPHNDAELELPGDELHDIPVIVEGGVLGGDGAGRRNPD